MILEQKQMLFADNVAALLIYIRSINLRATFGEAYRTKEQAEIYYKQGKGIEDSLHCKRLAIDLNLFDEKGNYLTDTSSYMQSGMFWEGLHNKNRWGGRFLHRPDGNHFEMQE